MKKTSIFRIILSGLMLAGCLSIDPSSVQEDVEDNSGKVATIEFALVPSVADEVHTKSSFSWSEDDIKDVELIAVTDDGEVEDVIYVPEWRGRLSFTGNAGQNYTFYVMANNGKRLGPSSVTELMNTRMSVSYTSIGNRGIPMSSDPEGVRFMMPAQGGKQEIALTRMLARVDISLDLSLLTHVDQDGFKIKSAKIYNAINSYSPFSPEVRQEQEGGIDYRFDSCSSNDLEALNSGETVSLYAFENMQGDLLPLNRDPWKKVPEQISGADCCSYVEVIASYSSQGLRYDDITYRMYLGKDCTTNFDVRRNTVYSLVLRPTEDELDGHRGSWKLSSSGWDDVRTLRFKPSQITVPPLGSATAMIEMTPEAFEIALKDNGWLSQASCTMDYDHAEGTMTITNAEELDSDVSGVISAISWDGALYDACIVTVKAPVRIASLRFVEEEMEIYVNGPFAGEGWKKEVPLIVTYSDGTEKEVRGDLESSDTSIVEIDGAFVTGKTKGRVQINASYTENGVTIYTDAPATVKVTDPLLSLTAEPGELIIAAGESYDVGTAIDLEDITVLATHPSGRTKMEFSQLSAQIAGLSASNAFTIDRQGVIYAAEETDGATADLILSHSDEGITKSAKIRLTSVAKTLMRLYFVPDSAEIEAGERVELKLYAEYDMGSDVLVGDYASWSADNDCISYESSGSGGCMVTGQHGGTSTLTASYGGMQTSATITVIQRDEIHKELAVTPGYAMTRAGTDVRFKATLYTVTNGDRDSGDDVSRDAIWRISPASGASISQGVASTSSPGLYTIRCVYDGLEAIASMTVLPGNVITHELVLSVKQVNLQVGEQAQVNAVWYTLTNGVRDSGSDVTSAAAWFSEDNGIALVSEGTINAVGEGHTLIKATYSGIQAEVEVEVSQEHELVVSPASIRMKEGETAGLTAIWYSMTNGSWDSGVDVTLKCEWNSSDHNAATVTDGRVDAIHAGQAVITAGYRGMEADALVTVEKEDARITAIKVSPKTVVLEKNGTCTMAVTAVWSDGSQTAVPNDGCDWTLSSGSPYFTLSEDGVVRCVAAGGSGSGRVSLKSAPDLSDAFTMECSTELALKASVEVQNTWGGNTYPLTFTFDDQSVLPDLTSVSCSGGAPSDLIDFFAGDIVAKDWWGMSGSWVTEDPTYTLTFSYRGYTTTVTGVMHGITGFKDVKIEDAYYSDIRTTPVVSSAYLTGSGSFYVKNIMQVDVRYDEKKQLHDGYLMVGSYDLDYSVVDPTNRKIRRGSSSFNVMTNVVEVFGTVTVSNNSYVPYNNGSHNVRTNVNGGNMGRIMIYTNGHDETLFTVKYDLSFVDVHGRTHKATYPLVSPDYGSVPNVSSPGGVVPMEDSRDEYSINGFSFSITWQGQ